MNHKPATPLPWYRAAADRHVQLTPESSGPALRIARVEGCDTDPNPADVRYIVHAANAYPQLVEALRDLLAHAETKPVLTGDGVKAVRAAGKFMKSLETARSLLLEIGEV